MIKTKTIRQSVTIKASPHDVYEALMDSGKHSRFTGSEAKISRKVGGFSAYFVELSPKIQDDIIARTIHSF